MDAHLTNDELIRRFEQWLLASYRTDGTVTLRIRHARMLAGQVQMHITSDERRAAALATVIQPGAMLAA